jgi:hypothetical protein
VLESLGAVYGCDAEARDRGLSEDANEQTKLSVAVNNEDRPMPFVAYWGVYQDVSK